MSFTRLKAILSRLLKFKDTDRTHSAESLSGTVSSSPLKVLEGRIYEDTSEGMTTVFYRLILNPEGKVCTIEYTTGSGQVVRAPLI